MTTTLEPTDKDFERMMQMLTGYWVTQIAGAVATYSIADHLAKGPATAEQISTIEGIDPAAALRLLRACASLGLVTSKGKTFSETPLLGTLRADVAGSLHGFAIAWSAPGHWLPWGRFVDSVRTGEPQLVPALGAKLAIDIGGASGTLVHGLLMANLELHGIVLDLPDVVPNATAAAAALGLAGRSRAMAGDFFTNAPEADIYLLKFVLHDWNDEEAVRILKTCRHAMRPGGRVIVIEMLLGEFGEPGIAPLMDLNMMVLFAGRERTLAEYSGLLKDAGLRFSKSIPIRSPIVAIEAVAA
jgi:O-methyltransferase domain/Dimerisation domain